MSTVDCSSCAQIAVVDSIIIYHYVLVQTHTHTRLTALFPGLPS